MSRSGPVLFSDVAARASQVVLRRYSTSFGLGSRLLDPVTRSGIEAIYGLVRVADEIVDTFRTEDSGPVLQAYHRETLAAIDRGWSPDLVIHSFARVARCTGIGRNEIDPFFHSMAMDITQQLHDRDSFDTYVYGSAEVVGLMCLAVFLNPGRPADGVPIVGSAEAQAGAQALGAAFQKINFLRDLGHDQGHLGRVYLPGLDTAPDSEAELSAWFSEIEADLDVARVALAYLPPVARRAVAVTIALYGDLVERMRYFTLAQLVASRVRVPTLRKLTLAVGAVLKEAS